MKKIVKIVETALGALGVVLFAIPVPLGIINIGNCAGMGVSALLVYLGLVPEEKDAGRKASREGGLKEASQPAGAGKKCPRIFRIAARAVCAVSLITAVALTIPMVRAASVKPADDATVVVLGCRVYGDRPSLMLVCRLEAALDYLKSHPSAKCVVSGGRGSGENISEAECMRRWLVAEGIEDSRIFLEDRSGDTRENLMFSSGIIEKQGLSKNLAIVTDGFHEYRAGAEARSLGLDFGAVPAKTPWWLLPTFTVREYFGILYSFVKKVL